MSRRLGRFVGPSIIKTWNNAMRQVVKDLSKCIIIYSLPIQVECPNCLYDVAHQKSSGVREWKPITSCYTIFSGTQYEKTYCMSGTDFNRGRCPVCYGRGQLEMPNITTIDVLVTWQFAENASTSTQGNRYQRELYWPSGLENRHSCRIKTHSCHFDLIKEAEYFTVDGYDMILWNDPNLRGLGEKDGILIAYLVDKRDEFIPK